MSSHAVVGITLGITFGSVLLLAGVVMFVRFLLRLKREVFGRPMGVPFFADPFFPTFHRGTPSLSDRLGVLEKQKSEIEEALGAADRTCNQLRTDFNFVNARMDYLEKHKGRK